MATPPLAPMDAGAHAGNPGAAQAHAFAQGLLGLLLHNPQARNPQMLPDLRVVADAQRPAASAPPREATPADAIMNALRAASGGPPVDPLQLAASLALSLRGGGHTSPLPELEDREEDIEQEDNAEPQTKRRKKAGQAKAAAKAAPKQRYNTRNIAGGGFAAMAGGGQSGVGRFISFTSVHLDGCDAAVTSWTLSTDLHLSQEENGKFIKLSKNCSKRQAGTMSDNVAVLNDEAGGHHDDLDYYGITFDVIVQLNGAWIAFGKDTRTGDITLVTVTGLLDTMKQNPALKSIWRDGQRVPLYQRQNLSRLKVTFIAKERPLNIRNLLVLLGPESCEENCPAVVADRMPTAHAHYTPADKRKESHLKDYWTAGKYQFRLYDHALRMIYVWAVNKDFDLLSHLHKLFMESFPNELQDAMNPQGDRSGASPSGHTTPAQPAAGHAAPEETDENVSFDMDDIDFGALETLCITESDKERRQTLKHLMTEDAENNARWLLAICWPDRFKSHLGAALDQLQASPPAPWLKTMNSCTHFTELKKKAAVFHKQLLAFDSFSEKFKTSWNDYKEFKSITANHVQRIAEGPYDQGLLKDVTVWSNKFSNLQSMLDIDHQFKDLDECFDAKVMGDMASTFWSWRLSASSSLIDLVYVCKGLAFAPVVLASKLPPTPEKRVAKLTILDAGLKLAMDALNLAAKTHMATSHEIRNTEEGTEVKETAASRIQAIADFAHLTVSLNKVHIKVWEPILHVSGEEKPEPDEDTQQSYNELCQMWTRFREGVKADGEFWWALNDAKIQDARMPALYKKLLTKNDDEIIVLMTKHHEDLDVKFKQVFVYRRRCTFIITWAYF